MKRKKGSGDESPAGFGAEPQGFKVLTSEDTPLVVCNQVYQMIYLIML
jgi:hypothetical protein